MSKLARRRGQDMIERALDILFPPRCGGCNRGGWVLCPSCLAQCVPVGRPVCLRCGTPIPAAGLCQRCKFYPPGLSGLRAAYPYQGTIRSCIHALKYEGNRRLAGPLGTLLAQAYSDFGLRADMIVPVPLHSEREQQRGYNHAQLLARVCAEAVRVPLRDDVVMRYRATAAQVGLSGSARRQNVAGAFCCTSSCSPGSLYGYSILLIDDVCTTGATLEACATSLFAAGAASVWALVLARRFS